MIPLTQTFLAAASDAETIRLDHWLIFVGVVQAIIFALQLVVFGYQAQKLQQTVKAAGDQSKDMKRSIDQATRAADAMERFAASAAVASQAATESVTTQKDTMTRLLRAYVCVNFGRAFFQSAESPKFEANAQLINVGQTPGYKFSYRAGAAVLPFPLPADFNFPLPEAPEASDSTLGHGQTVIFSAWVDRICSEEEAAEVRAGLKKRLYFYGTVTYEDVYHLRRYQNFCFSVIWRKDDATSGIFTKRHNDAD